MYPDPARAQFCGGSVIADSWAVTAAHCVLQPGVDSDPHRVDLVANTTFYKIGGDRVHVTAIYPNPHYDPRTSDSDIALLRLAAHTQPLRTIDIPNSTDPLPPETHLLVAGWGALIEGGSGSDYLVSAKMPVVSNTDCNKPESYDGAVTDNMFCAGLRSGGLDACQGDSGGPAVAYDDASHRPMLEGVIATGKGCARALKYGVYTAVRRFRSWIDQTIAAP
jgi:secreted trypsin-like serine protease